PISRNRPGRATPMSPVRTPRATLSRVPPGEAWQTRAGMGTPRPGGTAKTRPVGKQRSESATGQMPRSPRTATTPPTARELHAKGRRPQMRARTRTPPATTRATPATTRASLVTTRTPAVRMTIRELPAKTTTWARTARATAKEDGDEEHEVQKIPSDDADPIGVRFACSGRLLIDPDLLPGRTHRRRLGRPRSQQCTDPRRSGTR